LQLDDEDTDGIRLNQVNLWTM